MSSFMDVGGIPTVAARSDSDHHQGYNMWGMWIFALVIIFLALVFLWGRNREDRGHHFNAGEIMAAGMMHQKPPIANYDGGYNNHHEHWDIVRDENREFGNLKKENAENSWTLSREQDRNHYETGRLIDQRAFENARLVDQTKFDAVNATNQAKFDLSRQGDQQFYAVDKNVDSVKAQNAVDTRIILEGISKGNMEILNKMSQLEIQNLRDEVAKERLAASQYRQDLLIQRGNERVIDQLRPQPIRPAYGVHAPTPYPPPAACHMECGW